MSFLLLFLIIVMNSCLELVNTDKVLEEVTEKLVGRWQLTRIVSPFYESTTSDRFYEFQENDTLILTNSQNTITERYSYILTITTIKFDSDTYEILHLTSSEMIIMKGDSRYEFQNLD